MEILKRKMAKLKEQGLTSSRTGAKLGYSISSGAMGDPRSSTSEPDSAFDVSLIRSGN